MLTSEEVGRRIRDARTEKGWTQAQLGQMLARPRTHAAISDIERGRTKLNIDEIAELASRLEKPLTYFTGERSSSGVSYRRSNQAAAPEQRRQQDAAVESFRERMRKQFGTKSSGREP